jgi:poly-gamma-glutamate capsule biosynthesis protein CapA/YwtB (metallophosphatase superfamily)
MRRRPMRMFFCGDVMLGRGIDQILPHPGDPRLQETYVRDARHYVELAERVNGAIPRPVDYSWPWGDALEVLTEQAPDLRVVNLETSITRGGVFTPGKAVHYRMSPDNIACLAAVRPDVCVLANNHLLDFGRHGLAETLETLFKARLGTAGAGLDAAAAERPAVALDGMDGRVLVFSYAMPSSGAPLPWAATPERPGIALVREPSFAEADRILTHVRASTRPGDRVVVSVHWGSNWGYRVSRRDVQFAHRLVDGGVDVVHGHSSHHPRPIEVYRGKLILYGCGDFIDDYEGITGHEEYRDDLRLMYFVSVEPDTGALLGLRMVPLKARQLRLHRASSEDAAWLQATLTRISNRFDTRINHAAGGNLQLAR